MNKEFESVRERMLLECSRIIGVESRTQSLSRLSSWGSNPDKLVTKKAKEIEKKIDTNISDQEFKMMIKSFVSNHFNISFALLSRLELIQMSSSKLLDGWKGTSSDLYEIRFITERYAILTDIINKYAKETGKISIDNKQDLFALSTICQQTNTTMFNWHELVDKSFEEMGKTKYKFDEERDLQNLMAKNIMSAIDRVERARLDGLRAFYCFLCEFVHPNVGDGISCTFNTKLFSTGDGADLRLRKLSHLSKPMDTEVSLNGDAKLMIQSYVFATRMLKDFQDQVSTILGFIEQSKKETKKLIHKSVKQHKKLFHPKELCPCGSGKSVKMCK
jgi:hypothetical protein